MKATIVYIILSGLAATVGLLLSIGLNLSRFGISVLLPIFISLYIPAFVVILTHSKEESFSWRRYLGREQKTEFKEYGIDDDEEDK